MRKRPLRPSGSSVTTLPIRSKGSCSATTSMLEAVTALSAIRWSELATDGVPGASGTYNQTSGWVSPFAWSGGSNDGSAGAITRGTPLRQRRSSGTGGKMKTCSP